MGRTLQAYRKIFEAVKAGKTASLYFLYGPEEYLRRELVRELIKAVLPGSNRAFNLDIFHGDEFDRALFDDRVSSFPLFAERRMVILKNFTTLAPTNQDHVIDSAKKLPDALTLVVETNREKQDTARMRNMKKTADAGGVAFQCKYLDEQETVDWALGRFRRDGYRVEPPALDLLVESVGTQLGDLSNEVEKLMLSAGDDQRITPELVGEVVGKYRTENLFSVLDTVGGNNASELIRRLNMLIDGGEEPIFVLAMLLKRVVLMLEVKTISDDLGARATTGKALAERMAGATSPFYADILRRQATRFTRDQLTVLLDNLRWADLKAKSTPVDSKSLIEEALLASSLGKTLAYPPVWG